jgi:hypothetical protein
LYPAATATTDVGIGTATPNAKLGVFAAAPLTVGGSSSVQQAETNTNANVNTLTTSIDRFDAAASWSGCRWRIQHKVDATNMGFIDFNPTASSQGVALGTAGALRLSIALTGRVTVTSLAGAGNRMVIANPDGELYTQAIPAGGGEWTQAGGSLYPSTLSSSVGIGIAAPAAPLDIKAGTFRGLFDNRADGFTISAVDDGNTAYDVLSLQGSRVQLNPGGGGVSVGTTTVNKPGYSLQVNGAVLAVDANANYAMLETVTGNGFRWILSGGNLLLQNTTDGFATGANPIVVSGTTIQFVTLAGAGTRMVVADANGLLSSAAIPPTYTLPARLGTAAQVVTDWDTATENGWYQAAGGANAPTPAVFYIGMVVCHLPAWVTQTVHDFTAESSADTQTWQRNCKNGAWGAWYRLRISQEEQEALYAGVNGARAYGDWNIGLSSTSPLVGYSASGEPVSVTGLFGGSQFTGQGGGAAMLSFHRPNSYAVNFGLDVDNVLKVGGFSMGEVANTILHSGNYSTFANTMSINALPALP